MLVRFGLELFLKGVNDFLVLLAFLLNLVLLLHFLFEVFLESLVLALQLLLVDELLTILF